MGLTSTGTYKDVRMIDETISPAEFMANNPNLNKMIKNWGVGAEKVNEVSSSVVCIRGQGVKQVGKS